MKTKLITLLIVITAIIGSAYAQKKVIMYKNDAVVYSEYIAYIDSITFLRVDYQAASYKVLPAGTGTVTINGSSTTPCYVLPGTSVTLTATPNEGYVFVNWTVNGEEVSTENPYTATVTANTEF